VSRNLLKSFGLPSISTQFDSLFVLLSCWLQDIFRKFGPIGKSYESGRCFINGLFGLVVFASTHWLQDWIWNVEIPVVLYVEGDLRQVRFEWLSSVRSSGSHHVFHHHQLIWGGFEVLVDSYYSSWSRFWCVFVLLCLQQKQEGSSSAQMNHRVEIWFLFIIWIDWIMKLWISYQPGTSDLRWIINSTLIQFIWFAHNSPWQFWYVFVCGFPEMEVNWWRFGFCSSFWLIG